MYTFDVRATFDLSTDGWCLHASETNRQPEINSDPHARRAKTPFCDAAAMSCCLPTVRPGAFRQLRHTARGADSSVPTSSVMSEDRTGSV